MLRAILMLALILAPATAEARGPVMMCTDPRVPCMLDARPPIAARRSRLRIGPVCAPAFIEGVGTVQICAPAHGR